MARLSISKLEWGVGVGISAFLVLLHISFMLHAGGLWRDEVNTVQLASLPTLGGVWEHLQYDSFPVLWPLVLRAWITIAGGSDTSLRILGLLVGLSLLAALWWVSRTVNRSIPLFSLVLFALNPAVIRYGDSMRAYGFGMFLAIVSGGLIWKIVQSPTRRSTALALITAVMSVHTLYYNAILLFAFGVGGMAVTARRLLWKRTGLIAAIGLTAGLSLLPYASTISRMREWNMLVQFQINLQWIWLKINEAVSPAGPFMIYVWLALFGLAIFSALYFHLSPREDVSGPRKDVLIFSTVTLIGGTVSYICFLRVLSYFTQPWYYVALLALIGVAVDLNLSVLLSRRYLKGAQIALVLLLVALTSARGWSAVQARQTNIDLIASKLTAAFDQGDLVLLLSWFSGVSFNRYHDAAVEWKTLPDIQEHRLHRYDLLKAKMAMTNPIEELFETAARTLRSGGRIWIVGTPLIPPPGQKAPRLPPAPHPQWGWVDWPYTESWAYQFGEFLRDHALRLEPVEVPGAQRVNRYENFELWLATGWRDE